MIKPLAKRDWYRTDAACVAGLPGVGVDLGNIKMPYSVHRTHLPLIDHEAAQRILDQREPMKYLATWLDRDAWTAERGFKLRVTQQQAIDFVNARPGVLIGDEMRLGKTVSAIMAHDPSSGPFFVIAPLSTRAVWLGWLNKIFPEHADNIGVITGHEYNAETLTKPIVFGHYDVIHKWMALGLKIGTCVFDEAHLLTNPGANRSQAAVLLARQAQKVLALTGTPIWNLPPNLWNVLGLVAPGAWGSYHEFARRYGLPVSTAHGNKYTGVSNERELHLRLSEVMIRRRWIDCHDDLPAITRSVVVAEVNDAERKKLDILAGKLKSERTNTIGNLAAYRRQVTNLKESVVCAEAKKITSRGEPVVIWTWHKDYAERLGKRLENSFVIHGDIDPTKRDLIMDQWRACPSGILIATMAVAQVGIDLSHARIAIFAEIDYTPAILGQAEMRTYAPDRSMDVIFVVADHIVDQRIVRALVHKLSASDPLGVGAACEAIDALRDAVIGPVEVGDLDRMMEDLLASAA